jgi:hypothetical protein
MHGVRFDFGLTGGSVIEQECTALTQDPSAQKLLQTAAEENGEDVFGGQDRISGASPSEVPDFSIIEASKITTHNVVKRDVSINETKQDETVNTSNDQTPETRLVAASSPSPSLAPLEIVAPLRLLPSQEPNPSQGYKTKYVYHFIIRLCFNI